MKLNFFVKPCDLDAERVAMKDLSSGKDDLWFGGGKNTNIEILNGYYNPTGETVCPSGNNNNLLYFCCNPPNKRGYEKNIELKRMVSSGFSENICS